MVQGSRLFCLLLVLILFVFASFCTVHYALDLAGDRSVYFFIIIIINSAMVHTIWAMGALALAVHPAKPTLSEVPPLEKSAICWQYWAIVCTSCTKWLSLSSHPATSSPRYWALAWNTHTHCHRGLTTSAWHHPKSLSRVLHHQYMTLTSTATVTVTGASPPVHDIIQSHCHRCFTSSTRHHKYINVSTPLWCIFKKCTIKRYSLV